MGGGKQRSCQKAGARLQSTRWTRLCGLVTLDGQSGVAGNVHKRLFAQGSDRRRDAR